MAQHQLIFAISQVQQVKMYNTWVRHVFRDLGVYAQVGLNPNELSHCPANLFIDEQSMIKRELLPCAEEKRTLKFKTIHSRSL